MSKLLSQMGLVSAVTMLSRIFGLFRDMLITAVFGASLLNSAFTAAFALPSLFRRLLGEGALAAALMPNLSEELETKGREAVFSLVNKTLSWLIVVCVSIAIAAHWIFNWLEAVSTDPNRVAGAELAKLVFPYIIPICLAAIVSSVLNLLGRFAIPAMTSIWLNASMMLFLGAGGWRFADTPEHKMLFLCLGTLAGGALQFAIPTIALMREGWRPRLDFAVSRRLRAVLFLTVPGVFGAASHQLNVIVSRFLALDFNESGATLIYLANRLVELPLGVFTIAITTVVFPALSLSIAKGDDSEYEKTCLKGISLSMLLTIPAAVGLAALAPEIVSLLFQRGAFTASDTQDLVPILVICAAGMPFYAIVSIETRAFYAIKDARTPVRGSALGLAINIVLSISLLTAFKRIEALVIASNLATAIQSVYLHRSLRAAGRDIRIAELIPSFAKYIAGSAILALVAWGLKAALTGMGGAWQSPLTVVGISIPLCVALYFAVLKGMRMPEVDEMLAALRRRG